MRDDQEGVTNVVEADDGVVDGERGLGQAQDVARRRRKPLETPSGLVADVADSATRKARQVARRRTPVAPDLLAEHVERVGVVGRAYAAVLKDRCHAIAKHEGGAREDADE